MLYFAYGSNLDWAQMRERCPSSCFIAVAKLENHRLAFTRYSDSRSGGVADLLSEEGHDAWGVVYEIDERDIGRLDKCEGFRPGRQRQKNYYVREERHVYQDGNTHMPFLVSLYFAVPQTGGPFPPHPNYKRLIVDGAKYWHLPEHYIVKLEAIKTQ
jgi:gamma-glutamylcyclotransferase